MPWSTKRHRSCPHNKPWAVVKDEDGALVACHRTRTAARRQQRALYASETKELSMPVEETDALEKEMESWRPLGGATSFSQLEEYEEAAQTYEEINSLGHSLHYLIDNILNDPGIDDKSAALAVLVDEYKSRIDSIPAPSKSIMQKALAWFKGESTEDPYALVEEKAVYRRENGIDFPIGDYAYAPDPKRPTTWKLRLTESPGKVSLTFLNRAAAALSASGRKAGVPDAALTSVKRRVRAAYRTLGVSENRIPSTVKEASNQSPLYIWKDAETDQYNFIAVYSNNIRDDDNPPEIISEKAHHAFAESLKMGVFDYPELWHWHIPGTRWGKTNHIFVVDGFPVALGTIDKGFEETAEAIMSEMPYPIALSHGMPTRYIVRNDDDPSVIDFYVSTEISTLPKSAAANKWTSFNLFKEKELSMPLSDAQRDFLKRARLPENVIEGLDGLGDLGKSAEALGRERKEATVPEPEVEAPIDLSQYSTTEEVAKSIGEVIMPLLEAVNNQTQMIKQLQTEIDSLKGVQKNMTDNHVEMTPVASLSDMLRNNIFGETSKAALDPQRDAALLNQRPAEKESATPEGAYTGVGFLDDLVANTYGPNGGMPPFANGKG